MPTFGTQKRFIIFLSQELEQVNYNEVIQNADLKFGEHVSTNTEKANVMIDLIRRSAISRRPAFQGTFHCVCMTPFLMWSGNLG